MYMLIGYARVSKNEQNLDLQRDALIKAGCTEKNIFTDKITGTKADRIGLAEAMTHLRAGDTFAVWRLDRLGRSLKHLIETVTKLQEQKIAFKSITENIDTTTSMGRLIFHINSAYAEFEREIIRDRVVAGIKAKREKTGTWGRKVLASELQQKIKDLIAAKQSIRTVAKTLDISTRTVRKYKGL